MKRKLLSVITALALCLSLLPGTAWAVDETGVKFVYQQNSVTLENGGYYVAAADNNGIEKVEADPGSGAYLAYSDGTLTVHGAFVVNAVVTLNSDLTITGEADSSLSITSSFGPPIQLSNHTLTLSGGVDFAANSIGAPVINSSTGKFETTETYSGNIALSCAVNIPAVSDTTLNVQNSGSIAITGMINAFGKPVALKSTGDVTIVSGDSLSAASLTVEGKDVSISHDKNNPVYQGTSLNIKAKGSVTIQNGGQDGSPTIIGTAEISAKGTVTISGGSLPIVPSGATASLTISGAQTVNITGASSANTPLISVPYTFEGCNSVTVTDSGDGELLTKDVPVTSDKPWTATTGGTSVTMPSGRLTYDETDITNTVLGILPNAPTAYKAGDGWVFYEPPKDGNPAKLTLDNAQCPNGGVMTDCDVSVEVKGSNYICLIGAAGTVTVNQDGGTLNALVDEVDEDQNQSYTVYGKLELPAYLIVGASDGMLDSHLTIPQGTELTIPSDVKLVIYDTAYLKNQGTLVNNGKVILTGDAAEGDVAQTIKSLGLTGTGTVVVGEMDDYGNMTTVQGTYFNSGVKLLEPAGTLDLSSATLTEEQNEESWEKYGYKWEVLEKEAGTDKILKAILILAEGFNAEEVTLPGNGANVTVKTEGESLIGELKYKGDSTSTSIKLTFEGGKLVIAEHINFSGDVGTSVTIAKGAVVEASKGITAGAAAGVDGTITVNGSLTARGESGGAAVLTGKISVGPSGKLEVYGDTGVFLGGMSTDDINKPDFTGAFLLSPGGRFTGNCETDIIAAQRNNGGPLEDSLKAEDVIVIPKGYLPRGLAPVFNGDRTKLSIPGDGSLFNISVDNVPRPSGGGGGGGVITYAVTVEKSEHGEVSASCASASSGTTVTLTVTPDGGYVLSALTVTDSRGNEIKLTAQGDGKYTFTMPSRAVTVKATFACDGGENCPSRRFDDLDTGAWYHEAVDYVLENDLMDGYDNGLFGPNDTLTRAQFVQILFNKEGRPVINYLLRYDDAAPGAWYTEAVRWAAGLGIAGGYGNGMFGPNDNITREQLVVILWRYAGSPAATEKELHFTDADQASGYALEALRWAAESGVLNDRDGILEPAGQVTRAETAQMLKIFMEGQ